MGCRCNCKLCLTESRVSMRKDRFNNVFRALCSLPKVEVKTSWEFAEDDEAYTVSVELENVGEEPALMLKLNLLNNRPVNSGPAPDRLQNSTLTSRRFSSLLIQLSTLLSRADSSS